MKVLGEALWLWFIWERDKPDSSQEKGPREGACTQWERIQLSARRIACFDLLLQLLPITQGRGEHGSAGWARRSRADGCEWAGVSERVWVSVCPKPQTPAGGGRQLVEASRLPAGWSSKQATGHLRSHCIVVGEAASCCRSPASSFCPGLSLLLTAPYWPSRVALSLETAKAGHVKQDEEEVLGNTGQEKGMGSRPQVMDQWTGGFFPLNSFDTETAEKNSFIFMKFFQVVLCPDCVWVSCLDLWGLVFKSCIGF